jgi:ABC-2 type transport system ATP-binding protein
LVEHLSKRFGDVVAVDDVSFAVPRGEFFGFLGPNGAGKSTTIRVLCGLTRADYHRIEIAGHDLRREPLAVKASIGVMLEDPLLYERLSAREHLRFTGQLYGLPREQAEARADELLSLLEMQDFADRLIVDYSQGMRKKAALACALVHDPPVLFLDEPFNGIDAVSARHIKDLLKAKVDAGATVMFSSHVMEVVERLCTAVAIINHGRIVLVDTMDNLRDTPGYSSMEDLFIDAVEGRKLPAAAEQHPS